MITDERASRTSSFDMPIKQILQSRSSDLLATLVSSTSGDLEIELDAPLVVMMTG